MDNSEGNYFRTVGPKELVLEVQQKWKDTDVGYFELCKHKLSTEDGDSMNGMLLHHWCVL